MTWLINRVIYLPGTYTEMELYGINHFNVNSFLFTFSWITVVFDPIRLDMCHEV
jgi:hypothetical protein